MNLHIFNNCTKCKEDKLLGLKQQKNHNNLKTEEKNHSSIGKLIQFISFIMQCFYWMLNTTLSMQLQLNNPRITQ